MNPHLFFLGAVVAGRLVTREAHSADRDAPVAKVDAGASLAKPPIRPR